MVQVIQDGAVRSAQCILLDVLSFLFNSVVLCTVLPQSGRCGSTCVWRAGRKSRKFTFHISQFTARVETKLLSSAAVR
jgi:hypothetical protein